MAIGSSIKRSALVGTNFADALDTTLRDVLECGELVPMGEGPSIGSGRTTRELLNYSFTLASARDRLSARRPVSAIGAVGRFVWMLSGSDRLEDIRFYEEKVSSFTDDGISVPGSDYGKRLFEPIPGLDQVYNALASLRAEAGSRRAAASIFHPWDSGRDSKDIPCTFGLFWHVREGLLHATTVMRSNNAWTLLPYNVFEFSLLADVMAADLGTGLGRYSHFAVSMHLYEDNIAAVQSAMDATPSSVPAVMASAPEGPMRDRVAELMKFEIRNRYGAAGLTDEQIPGLLRQAEDLGPFWSDLAVVLLGASIRHRALSDSVAPVLGALGEPLRSLLHRDLSSLGESASRVTTPEIAKLEIAALRTDLGQESEEQQAGD